MSQQWWVGAVFAAIILAGTILNGIVPGLGLAVIGLGLVGIIWWVLRRYRKERPKPPWPPSE